MTVRPITNDHPACYGICCPQRGQCERYDLVEDAEPHETQSTCEAADHTRPMFLQKEVIRG